MEDLEGLYEPHHEKTCIMGFQPGLTQTGLQARGLKFLIKEVEPSRGTIGTPCPILRIRTRMYDRVILGHMAIT